MKAQMGFFFVAVLMALNSFVCAGNVALSRASTVPAGERIANYLQGVMTSAGEVVSAKNGGDIFAPKDPYRLSFDYDSERQVIDVYVVGNMEKAEDIKSLFDLTQKLVLRLNDKIQKFYGVTLTSEDLSMDYLNVNSGKVIMKFMNGQYVDKTVSSAVMTPTGFATPTNN